MPDESDKRIDQLLSTFDSSLDELEELLDSLGEERDALAAKINALASEIADLRQETTESRELLESLTQKVDQWLAAIADAARHRAGQADGER